MGTACSLLNSTAVLSELDLHPCLTRHSSKSAATPKPDIKMPPEAGLPSTSTATPRQRTEERIPVLKFSGTNADFIKTYALIILVAVLFFNLGMPDSAIRLETVRHHRAMEKIYQDLIKESVAWRGVLSGGQH